MIGRAYFGNAAKRGIVPKIQAQARINNLPQPFHFGFEHLRVGNEQVGLRGGGFCYHLFG